jgi:GH24 family phage-related lysozyme (muramidase)
MSMQNVLDKFKEKMDKQATTALAVAALVAVALPVFTPQSAAAESVQAVAPMMATRASLEMADPGTDSFTDKVGNAVSAFFHHDGDNAYPVNSETGRRTISPPGLQIIKDFEGLELTGYLLGDGMCTIGYGHAEPASTRPDCRQWTITEAEAEAMLQSDVQIYADAVSDWFTRDFNQNQFDALTSWMYNVGPGVFEKYGWATDPDDERIAYNLGLYVFPAKFSEGLKARRAAEIALFQS